MYQLLEFYGRWSAFRERFVRLPALARLLVGIVALPGIVLVVLSILAFVVSLAALLLLTVPLYRVLSALFPTKEQGVASVPAGAGPDVVVDASTVVETPVETEVRPTTRRQIEVKIVE
jgi:hypothetical protein